MRRSGTMLALATLLYSPAAAHAAADVQGPSTQAVADGPQATANVPTPETPTATGDLQEPAAPAPGAAATRRWGFRTLFKDIGSDIVHLPSKSTLTIAAAGGAAAFAAHPLDHDLNAHLEGSSFFGAGNRLGNTFTMMGATFAVYGIGLATGHDRVTHVALDVVRAQVVSEVLVQTLKRSVRRERPDGSNRLSFPSGHAAITFATATVLERHHGLKWALPAYGLAAYVATSRLHDNVHYLSDVVFGAAVGTLAGRTVTRHGASTFAFAPMFVPGGAGVLVVRSPHG